MHHDHNPKTSFLSSFYSVMILLGCILNMLIILAILSVKEIRRRRANQFLASLCISDFLTCAYSMTYHLVHLHPAIYGAYISTMYCRATQYVIYVLAFSSTLCLMTVCVDRYIAITRPFRYLSATMNKVSKVLLIYPWVHSIVTSIPAIVSPIIEMSNDFGYPCAGSSSSATTRYFIAIMPINVIIPFTCILTTCTVVFRIARKQLHSIQVQVTSTRRHPFPEESSSSSSGPERNPLDLKSVSSKQMPPSNPSSFKIFLGSRTALITHLRRKTMQLRQRHLKNFREETRIAFATVAVVFGFMVAWTPYLLTRILFVFGTHLSNDVHIFGTVFVLANSAWNPLLILTFRRDIRKGILSLRKRWTKR